MKRIERILGAIAIVLGLLWLADQIDTTTSRNQHKWEKATAGYVQE